MYVAFYKLARVSVNSGNIASVFPELTRLFPASAGSRSPKESEDTVNERGRKLRSILFATSAEGFKGIRIVNVTLKFCIFCARLERVVRGCWDSFVN